MGAWWYARLVLAWCALGCACAGRAGGGGSLRSALEALQRRQRAGAERPHAPPRFSEPRDYDEALYELYGPPPVYDDDQYGVDVEAVEEAIPQKYVVKYLNEEEPRQKNYYEYKLMKKKKKSSPEREATVHKPKPSAFRERSINHHADERLKELFMDRAEENEKNKEKAEEQFENDAEYAVLLEKLWSKYKGNHPNYVEPPPEGVVKLYKERTIRKRQYPDQFGTSAWGPVAFKRKRSPSEEEEDDNSESDDYSSSLEYPLRGDDRLKYSTDNDDGYNPYELPSEPEKDIEEYAIAFQPVDGEKINLPTDGDEYVYDAVEKRFPVTKRSSGPYESMSQRKRSANSEQTPGKKFRGGSGTDPKVIRELSKIFGEPVEEMLKSPVKRSNKLEENSHETKPPLISAAPHNISHDQNMTHIHDDDSHEHQGHSKLHPPNLSGKEEIIETNHQSTDHQHPISLKKKSIDWSQYFGVDKRSKKSIPFENDVSEGLRRKYLETFNEEMNQAVGSRSHNKVKRDFIINKPLDESEFMLDRASAIAIRSEEKRNVEQQDDSKLDNIDRKLKGVESVILDEALHLSNIGGDIDSKEEQNVKEKTLARLAAAYSLEKMRKALKEFKHNLHTQRDSSKLTDSLEESKQKRIALKKEKAELQQDEVSSSKATETDRSIDDDFEGEQGAGHYLNGGTEEGFSEGYMGGSGRHNAPAMYRGGGGGSCPVLERIVQRCHGVEMLAGDPGQLFLPLCSLHQICYLCGQSPPTSCDLIFLSEADTACGAAAGESAAACQRAARATLMALRELHDALADALDGECAERPCLAAALRPHAAWRPVLQ